MHSSSSKRRALIKRIIAYTVMTCTVVVLSAILVLLMLGYRFNRYNGTIQQGGLVQFITQPSGANVFVGDIQLANKTRSKITLNPGEYLIRMQRDGYQPWQKNVTVKAGTVLWLNSARLIPENLETTPVLSLSSVASASAHPDADYFALLKEATAPEITLVDINNSDDVEQRTISLGATQYHTAKKHRFSLEQWLGDHRLLLKHTYGATQEWIVVDVNDPAESYAISSSEGRTPLNIIADPRSSDRVLVLYSNGSVTLENVASSDTTTLPVNNVTEISADGNTLFYTSKSKKGEVSTNYLTLGKTKPRLISTYPSESAVHFASSEYFGVRHVAASTGKKVSIDRASDWPDSDSADPLHLENVKTVTLSSNARFISFKSQGRFVVVQEQTAQTTYDIELHIESDVPIVGAERPLTRQLKWLDSFHYWSDADGQLRQYEFDGTNQADIVEVAPGFSAVYSSNQEYLYTVGKTDKGYQLQRTKMVID